MAAQGPIGTPEASANQQSSTLANPRYHRIAAFWDEKKNGDLQPADVRHKSWISVHLRCGGCPTCGRQHEWTAQPANLTKWGGKLGCPFCHGNGAKGRICACRTVASDEKLKGERSAANELRPELVALKSNKVVKWKCPKGLGHADYEARPCSRTLEGQGCPLCAGPRYGSVKEVRPELVAEWHGLNERSPENVTCGSGYKARWVCQKCSYEWSAKVSSRAVRGQGNCPRCAIERRWVLDCSGMWDFE